TDRAPPGGAALLRGALRRRLVAGERGAGQAVPGHPPRPRAGVGREGEGRRSPSGVNDALNGQVANEIAAPQQYVAVAVYYDAQTLPQLAAHFYRQAVEERNHAMMIVQYLLDADAPVVTPAVAGPQTSFADDREPIALGLAQEQTVTDQIQAL